MIVKKANLAVSLYLLASVPVFILVALPVLRGLLDFQFYADSPTYMAAAENLELGWHLVQISANYLGPVLIARLLRSSYALIYLFNVVVFLLSWRLVVRHTGVEPLRYFVLLAASPLVFTSLLSVNKEIIGLLALALFVAYLGRDRLQYLAAALLLSILARWQLTLVLLLGWGLMRVPHPLRHRRLAAVLVTLLAISVVYRVNLAVFEVVDAVASVGEQVTAEGSGLYYRMLQVQNAGGYFLVAIPKFLHQYVGLLARYQGFLDFGDKAQLYSNNFIFLQSVTNLCLLGLTVWTRRFTLRTDVVYLAVIYAMVFALSPIYSPRYFTPVSILLAVALAQPRPARARAPGASVPAAVPA